MVTPAVMALALLGHAAAAAAAPFLAWFGGWTGLAASNVGRRGSQA